MAEEIPKLNTTYHTHNGLDSPELDTDLVDDETPQLGGDLDLNGNQITSPDGTDLIDIPNGSIDLQTASTSRVDITDSGVRLGAANARVTTVLDEDAMGTDSATALATQQSIKAYVNSKVTFGGDGTDGALNITSGTTTLDASSVDVLVKNYTSINISSGATLKISNPGNDGTVLVLKSTGNVTIAGTIDLIGMGADVGNNGYGILDDVLTHFGAADVAGTLLLLQNFYPPLVDSYYSNANFVSCGSSGGNGTFSGVGATAGVGGRGGGALILECAGAFNFVSGGVIDLSGQDGADGVAGSGHSAGGGGGGAVGLGIVLYKTLTANAGTKTTVGGDGGDGSYGGEGGNTAAGGGGAGSKSAGSDGLGAGATGAADDGTNGSGAGGGSANAGGGQSHSGGSGGVLTNGVLIEKI